MACVQSVCLTIAQFFAYETKAQNVLNENEVHVHSCMTERPTL